MSVKCLIQLNFIENIANWWSFAELENLKASTTLSLFESFFDKLVIQLPPPLCIGEWSTNEFWSLSVVLRVTEGSSVEYRANDVWLQILTLIVPWLTDNRFVDLHSLRVLWTKVWMERCVQWYRLLNEQVTCERALGDNNSYGNR